MKNTASEQRVTSIPPRDEISYAPSSEDFSKFLMGTRNPAQSDEDSPQ